MQDRVAVSSGVSSVDSLKAVPGRSSRQRPPASRTERLMSLTNKLFLGVLSICIAVVVANVTVQATVQPADPNNILLDFSATWCGPCQQMSPIVSRLERQGYPIRKVDIDVEDALARKYKIESIPCFVLVANGREVTRLTGPREERELKQLMMMLPKQNIDEALVGKSSRGGGAIPVTNSSTKSSDDKKSFVKVPQLFSTRSPDVKLTPTEPDTIRAQSPSLEPTGDGFVRDPMHASTRIRVKDGSKLHYGSGSIIDSQSGRSIIVTCGHIFRDLSKDAVVEVDVFAGSGSKPQTVIGQILTFDLKSDLGLLSIPTKQQLPVVKLADFSHPLAAKDRVVSIGCGGGERPSREDHQVTAINKYLGADNVECNGVPQQGRSGGGLFLGSELVGICIAADPKEKRGIYTGLKPVMALLNKANLGYLAAPQPVTEEAVAEAETPSAPAALGTAVAINDESPRQKDDDVMNLINAASQSGGTISAGSADYIGAEIVCIVRPKTPGAASRVVIVNQASSRFVDDLLHESGGGRPDPTPASRTLTKSKPEKPATNAGTSFAMQKPATSETKPDRSEAPIETSFEPQRYRRPAQPVHAR